VGHVNVLTSYLSEISSLPSLHLLTLFLVPLGQRTSEEMSVLWIVIAGK